MTAGQWAEGDEPDYVVAGSGAAGLTAATLLAEKGYRVLVAEARPWAGGMLAYLNMVLPNGYHSAEYAKKLLERALDHGVEVLVETSLELCGPGEACLRGGGVIRRLRPRRGIILATGVTETPWAWLGIEADSRVYGLIPSSSLLSMINLLGYRPGRRILVYGCDWHAIASARAAATANGTATLVHPCPLPQGLLDRLGEIGVESIRGAARAAQGKWRLEKTLVETSRGERKVFETDTLVYSFVRPSPLVLPRPLGRGVSRVGGSLLGGEDPFIHASHAALGTATGETGGGEAPTAWRCVAKTAMLGSCIYTRGSCSPFQEYWCGSSKARSWAWNALLHYTRGCRRVEAEPSQQVPASVLRETGLVLVGGGRAAQVAGNRVVVEGPEDLRP